MSKASPCPPSWRIKTRNMTSVSICTWKKTVNTSSGGFPLKSSFVPQLGVPGTPFDCPWPVSILQKTHYTCNPSPPSILTTSSLSHQEQVPWGFTFSWQTPLNTDCLMCMRPQLEARVILCCWTSWSAAAPSTSSLTVITLDEFY